MSGKTPGFYRTLPGKFQPERGGQTPNHPEEGNQDRRHITQLQAQHAFPHFRENDHQLDQRLAQAVEAPLT